MSGIAVLKVQALKLVAGVEQVVTVVVRVADVDLVTTGPGPSARVLIAQPWQAVKDVCVTVAA